MTFLWFVIWFVSDRVGDREPLLLDPANAWTWTLLGAIALDLAGIHGRSGAHKH